MHNGQFSGYGSDRRHVDALLLMALAAGSMTLPHRPWHVAAARFEHLARQRGTAPHVRLAAAFPDGQRLYALRYVSHNYAPTLYHRWSDTHGGRAEAYPAITAALSGSSSSNRR